MDGEKKARKGGKRKERWSCITGCITFFDTDSGVRV